MYLLCLSCNTTLEPSNADSLISVVHKGTTIGVVCETCQKTTKSFRMSFTRETVGAQYTPLTFQCFETHEEDDRKDRYTDLDINPRISSAQK